MKEKQRITWEFIFNLWVDRLLFLSWYITFLMVVHNVFLILRSWKSHAGVLGRVKETAQEYSRRKACAFAGTKDTLSPCLPNARLLARHLVDSPVPVSCDAHC